MKKAFHRENANKNKSQSKGPASLTIRCPPIPSYTPKANNLKEMLMFAINLKGLEFRDSLYYLVPREKNNAYADKNDDLQEPSPETLIELRKFKAITSKGFYPFYIDGEAEYGLFGRAMIELQRGDLLCEYTGDVVINRDYLFYNSDDAFTLLTTGSSKNSLDIIPIKHCNASRFLNSVGSKNKKAKQNVIISIFNLN